MKTEINLPIEFVLISDRRGRKRYRRVSNRTLWRAMTTYMLKKQDA